MTGSLPYSFHVNNTLFCDKGSNGINMATDTFKVALYFNMAQVHHQGIVKGILDYARERGNWELFGAYWPMIQIKDFRKWKGDGIIAAVETPADIRILTRSGVPVVDTSGAIFDDKLSRVTNDNVEIGRICGRHLADHGLENFAFCGSQGSMWSEERLVGFEETTRPVRIGKIATFRRKIGWWHTPEFSPDLADFLSRQKRPLGVLSANDIVGMNVVGACRMAGLRIPDDIAIVSVDNEELLCELSTPPLSSIPFNRIEVGFRSAERLEVLMRKLLPGMPELRITPMELVERASSAAVMTADPLVLFAIAFIRNNAVNNTNAMEVAQALFTSKRNLERRFRDQTGRTILEEIHRTRIAYAKRLLRESDLSIKRISGASGFRTLDRFTAIFTRYAKMTPRQYRLENTKR